MLHLLGVRVLPILVCVGVVEVVGLWLRNERRLYFFAIQLLPVDVAEPFVRFHVLGPETTQTVDWLSLYQFVYEVHSFAGPSAGQILRFNLNLLGENIVSDRPPVLALKRPFAIHALIGNYTHRKVVHCNTVVLAAHHFGCHITRSARCVLGILWVKNSCNTEVGNPQIPLIVKNKVLRFDVSMQNAVLVKILKRHQHARAEEF